MQVVVHPMDVRVDAEPDVVWRVLTDLEGWSRWSPDFTLAARSVAVGRGVTVKPSLLPSPVPALPIPAKFLRVEEGRVLSWGGGVPGVLELEHAFELHGEGPGTRISHYESFAGPGSLAVRPVAPLLDALYASMSRGLRDHVEAMVR